LFFETSAKTAQNVDNLFAAIAKKIPLENMHSSSSGQRGGNRGPNGLNNGVNLMQHNNGAGGSGACAC
jgi:Ras-related protein Rab-5C